MKRIIIIMCVLCIMAAHTLSAQNKTIVLTENKVCQLIFPDKIKKYRGGFDPNMFALDLYDNILYVQCLATFKNSNLSVITEDDSYYIFDVLHCDTVPQSAYIITDADKIHQRTNEAAEKIKDSNVPVHGSTTIAIDTITQRVLATKEYLFSNNGIKSKGMSIFLKGIYAHGNKLYFRLDLTNDSQIPFTYNYIGFAGVSIKKSRASSADRYELKPTISYVPTTNIKHKQTLTVVYEFDKFTVGKDRKLLIEIIENNGERNFSFSITDQMILDARPLK